MLISLRGWIKKASAPQLESLAKFADTSVVQLRHMALGYRKGSAQMAVNINKASARFPSLPNVAQETVCPACRECKYRNAHNSPLVPDDHGPTAADAD